MLSSSALSIQDAGLTPIVELGLSEQDLSFLSVHSSFMEE